MGDFSIKEEECNDSRFIIGEMYEEYIYCGHNKLTNKVNTSSKHRSYPKHTLSVYMWV